MLYKLYGNIKGWDLVAVKGEVDEVFCLLDCLILEQHKENRYIIVEHDLKQNMDNVYASLNGNPEEYIAFKEEKQMIKKKR